MLIVTVFLAISMNAFGYVRNVGDHHKFLYDIVDSTGLHVTGQTVTLKIQRASDSDFYDFSSSTFKASGWTSKTTNLSEDSTNGFYYYSFTPPASETGPEQYIFVIDNTDATYGDHQEALVDYQNIGTSTATAGSIWDVSLSGHLTTGSTGKALNSAGGSGDPWSTDISSGYSGTQAGAYIPTLIKQSRGR